MKTRFGSKGFLIENKLLSENITSNKLIQGHAEICTGENGNIENRLGNRSCAARAVM